MIIMLLVLYFCVYCASAHSMQYFSNVYSIPNAGTNFFALHHSKHIDGNHIYYHFNDTVTRTQYSSAVLSGISSWCGLITGTDCTLAYNAHVNIIYDSTPDAPGAMGATSLIPLEPGDTDYHWTRHHITPPATIIFYYYDPNLYPIEKYQVAAHEIGHMWGIADLCFEGSPWSNHQLAPYSIYGGTYDPPHPKPTINDRNAMRIATKDYWFETSTVWWYHVSPYTKRLRADVYDFNGNITSSDARLILKFAAGTATPTDIQRILSDVDNNGEINTTDARYVLRYAAQQIDRFPADLQL